MTSRQFIDFDLIKPVKRFASSESLSERSIKNIIIQPKAIINSQQNYYQIVENNYRWLVPQNWSLAMTDAINPLSLFLSNPGEYRIFMLGNNRAVYLSLAFLIQSYLQSVCMQTIFVLLEMYDYLLRRNDQFAARISAYLSKVKDKAAVGVKELEELLLQATKEVLGYLSKLVKNTFGYSVSIVLFVCIASVPFASTVPVMAMPAQSVSKADGHKIAINVSINQFATPFTSTQPPTVKPVEMVMAVGGSQDKSLVNPFTPKISNKSNQIPVTTPALNTKKAGEKTNLKENTNNIQVIQTKVLNKLSMNLPVSLSRPLEGKISRCNKPGHIACDITAPIGTPVYASGSGVVEWSGWKSGGFGNYIVINHGNGVKTQYMHLSEVNVTQGQYINQGEHIGLVGSTGNSTGAHLHFGLIVNKVEVAPNRYGIY